MTHPEFGSCIAACLECADACDDASAACLRADSVQVMARRVELDNLLAATRALSALSSAAIDCAQVCRLAASYMARGSEWSRRSCSLCAEACDRCAAECERYSMAYSRLCAQACRRCARECRVVAKRTAASPAREAVPA